MDSITKEKDNTNQNPVSKFKPFEATYSEKLNTTIVRFDLPIAQRFGGKLEDKDIFGILSNYCLTTVSTIAKQINTASVELLMNEYDNQLYVQETTAFFSVLSEFIDGFTETLEMLERYKPETPAAESRPTADGDDLEILAKQISEILHNPKLPGKFFAALGDEITEFENDVHSPENVLHNLRELQKVS